MGLILGGALAGIGAGVAKTGELISREEREEEARAARAEERRLDAEERRLDAERRAEERKLERESREAIAEENRQLRRDQIAATAANTKSASASSRSFEKDSQGELAMSAEMGMTVPEFRRFIEAQKTGDTSAYEQGQVVDDESGGSVQKSLPAGFDKFMKEQRAQFRDAARLYQFGKDADNVEKARGLQQENSIRGLIAEGSTPAQDVIAARKINALSGKPEFKGQESGATNEFTGEQSANALGKAKVKTEGSRQEENRAQAGSANALADKRRSEKGGKDGEPGTMSNTQLINAWKQANVALSNARGAEDKKAARELSKQFAAEVARRGLTDEAGGTKAGKPDAKPKAGEKSAKSPFPEGANLVGKDGKKYVVRNGVPVPR